ncbi:MAG: YcgN family cysteine cluster protein [Rhodospirillales bacterium]
MGGAAPFWRTKSLEQMSRAEWESLCDGCAKCCLGKVEEPDTKRLVTTAVACRLLDIEACRCSSYADRHRFVPDCVRLDPRKARKLAWLPSTCAYRRLANGDDLPDWHPLVTGDPDSVHAAGQSVRGRALSERDAADPADHPAPWAE